MMRESLLVLYDAQWQKLRISTLKDFQDGGLGGWTTDVGTQRNFHVLGRYVDAATGQEKVVRMWRVLNMLDAVRMGNSGQGKQGAVHDLMVADYLKNVLRPAYQAIRDLYGPPSLQCLGFGTFETFETATRRETRNISSSDALYEAAVQNLLVRYQKHPTRSELSWYLDIVSTEAPWALKSKKYQQQDYYVSTLEKPPAGLFLRGMS